ncbi:unnamed protein product [Clavelina lepadiformis]|uniref:Uncharacterized protein n=1 Tax=Clavelina lepadiformis TaxID=159417 RepID=A0ABP0EZ49_CLALP
MNPHVITQVLVTDGQACFNVTSGHSGSENDQIRTYVELTYNPLQTEGAFLTLPGIEMSYTDLILYDLLSHVSAEIITENTIRSEKALTETPWDFTCLQGLQSDPVFSNRDIRVFTSLYYFSLAIKCSCSGSTACHTTSLRGQNEFDQMQ